MIVADPSARAWTSPAIESTTATLVSLDRQRQVGIKPLS